MEKYFQILNLFSREPSIAVYVKSFCALCWGLWNDWPMGACCITQRTLPSILWLSTWEKNLKENGYVYVYEWISLLYNQKWSQPCKPTILQWNFRKMGKKCLWYQTDCPGSHWNYIRIMRHVRRIMSLPIYLAFAGNKLTRITPVSGWLGFSHPRRFILLGLLH